VEDVKPCIGIAGKGHDVNLFDEYTGPFIVSGPCAVEELKPYFEARGDKDQIEVIYLNDHMNLAAITKAIEQVCEYSVEDTKLGKNFPFSKIQVLMSYFNAKLHGVNCMQTYV
jgi:hypothetical protein